MLLASRLMMHLSLHLPCVHAGAETSSKCCKCQQLNHTDPKFSSLVAGKKPVSTSCPGFLLDLTPLRIVLGPGVCTVISNSNRYHRDAPLAQATSSERIVDVAVCLIGVELGARLRAHIVQDSRLIRNEFNLIQHLVTLSWTETL